MTTSEMSTTRRELLGALALGTVAAPLIARPSPAIRAIAFDAFVLFNPKPVLDRARELVAEKAVQFAATASAKLFAYTWLYTSASRYDGFAPLARDAFQYAGAVQGLELTRADLDSLVACYSALPLWPDVTAAIGQLRNDRIRLAMLSNLPREMLLSNLRGGGIEHHFEAILSTDEVRRFKPAPEAYALGMRALGLARGQIGFAASAGWDASGATWFGYRTAWVNRDNSRPEEAHTAAEVVSGGIEGVLRLAGLGG